MLWAPANPTSWQSTQASSHSTVVWAHWQEPLHLQFSTRAFLAKMLCIHFTLRNTSAGKKAGLLLLEDSKQKGLNPTEHPKCRDWNKKRNAQAPFNALNWSEAHPPPNLFLFFFFWRLDLVFIKLADDFISVLSQSSLHYSITTHL